MRTIETQVFKYDELTDEAKAKARAWYMGVACQDNEWFENEYEYIDTVASIIGISVEKKSGRNSNFSAIYFSGFYSQGDGACFEGSYRYAKGALKAIKAYAPQDTELHRIAKELQDIQRRHFYQLRATTQHRGHYYHSNSMDVNVWNDSDENRDIDGATDDIANCMIDFADWIYSQLEKEYEYQTSDDVAEEMIQANEYEFDIDGNIA